MKVLITGATGFVGNALTKKFLDEGHQVCILTRNPQKVNMKVDAFKWTDTSTLPPKEAFDGIDGVINLMGENISAGRWTEQQKKLILTSRVDSTLNLIEALNLENKKLNFFVNASAVGIYPSNVDQTLDESSELGSGFLSDVCKKWEGTLHSLNNTSRKIAIRTGVVLGPNGGALKKMLPPFKLGLGGPLGDGKQIMSWIHLDDLVEIYYQCAINSHFSGYYNAVSPLPVTNREFTESLCHTLERPMFMNVPAFALKLAMGEMSSILLDSQRIIPTHLVSENFKFKYMHINDALNSILKK